MFSIAIILLGLMLPGNSGIVSEFLLHLRNTPESQRGNRVEAFIRMHPATPIIEEDTIVSFYWYGPAGTVAIAGDLQHGWGHPDTMTVIPCGTKKFFSISYHVPADARFDYQLVIHGKYLSDPRNVHIAPSGFGGPHSEAAMPKFAPTSLTRYRPHIPHGTIDSIIFKSKDTSVHSRPVKIYIPPGYETLSALPALYVHDGFESLTFAFYAVVIDNLIADGAIRPCVAVFIPPVERGSEYVDLKLDNFTDAICNELVPMVDMRFRTSHRPQDRAMVGYSNGAHLTLSTLIRRPDLFGNAAGESSTLTRLLWEGFMRAANEKFLAPETKIYLDVGLYDLEDAFDGSSYLEMNRKFRQLVSRTGVVLQYHEFHDGHEWASWRERTPDILKFFFGH